MKEQITGKWYEVKVQYHKETKEGTQKKVKETLCVAAFSFTEAETRATEEMASLADFEVIGITPAKYKEVFFDHDAEKYFRVRVMLIDYDERTGKEKLKTCVHLVQADSTELAEKRTREVYNQCILDYVITDINETRISDIIVPKQ